MDVCPCGSDQPYEGCCEPYILGTESAPTAEALMRARYTAYVKTEIDFIDKTTHSDRKDEFNRQDSLVWSKKTDWHSLEIRNMEAGEAGDDHGTVEFIARSRKKGKMVQHHELAEFKKVDGQWFFYDGQPPKYEQVRREGSKIGRNAPCPCGSGRKYKKCCA